MKIGILTLPLHTNYGGILQAYALQKALKDMGHEVWLIEEEIEEYKMPIWKAPMVYSKRMFEKHILKKDIIIFLEEKTKKEKPIIFQNINLFIEKEIQILRFSDFKEIPEDFFNAIIVGSDQIWRPKYFPNITNAYLDFSKNWDIIRIAYAASFGVDLWEYSKIQTKKCKELIKHFDFVTVREKSAVNLCKKYLNITPIHVLDPTMLLTKEDYKSIIPIKLNVEDNNLLVYLLDENKSFSKIISSFEMENNTNSFYVNTSNINYNIDVTNRIAPSVEEWIQYFSDAKYVLTDSFHGCVFSIIFNKPFVVIQNIDRGFSRINSLLESLNIENRVMSDSKDFTKIMNEPIDWIKIEKKIQDFKKKSFQILQLNNLNK